MLQHDLMQFLFSFSSFQVLGWPVHGLLVFNETAQTVQSYLDSSKPPTAAGKKRKQAEAGGPAADADSTSGEDEDEDNGTTGKKTLHYYITAKMCSYL